MEFPCVKLFIAVYVSAIMEISSGQNTMYFMEHMPQKQNFNPALMPKVDFYLNLPGVNGISFNAYNSGFNYAELSHFLDQLKNPN
jgi:hypothetical protein